MSTPSLSPQMPGGMPPAPPKSSGVKVILWIVGVLVALIVFVIVAMAGLGFFFLHKAKQAGLDPELIRKNPGLAAAKMVVMNNPELQVVSSNDNTGTMVVRDKRNGKTTTLKFDTARKTMVVIDEQGKQASITADADSGTIVMKGEDGTVKIGAKANSAPGWVPVYPGASPQNTMSVDEKGKQSGTYVFISKDSPEKIMSYYSEQLTSAGMKLTTTSGSEGGVISANQDSDARSVLVTVSSDSEGTHVSVTYGQNNKDGKGEL
jgi:hypothetical protein